jgi:hypothetical protein
VTTTIAGRLLIGPTFLRSAGIAAAGGVAIIARRGSIARPVVA